MPVGVPGVEQVGSLGAAPVFRQQLGWQAFAGCHSPRWGDERWDALLRRWLSIWRHSTISHLRSGLSCVSCSGRAMQTHSTVQSITTQVVRFFSAERISDPDAVIVLAVLEVFG
jgi:hypothetical protein